MERVRKAKDQTVILSCSSEEERERVKERLRTTSNRVNGDFDGHVVMRLSPKVWNRAIAAGALHINLQKVRVADYSSLVQSFLCLGYGHGRRFCKETATRCSHCGGLHMSAKVGSAVHHHRVIVLQLR